MANYEDNLYCNFNSSAAKAVAGKDILLAVFDATGTNVFAIAGQQGLTINRGADSIEVNDKSSGGWKSKIAGMKEWSIDNDGLYVADDQSHKTLGKAFDNGDPVCVKVVNIKKKKDLFGGLAYISDYSFEMPYDDAMMYTIALDGNGALVDLSESTEGGQMPTTGGVHVYTQAELENMTKAQIAQIAMDRGYDTVSEDDLKAEMITAFLAAQNA